MADQHLTTAQLADRLQVSIQTIYAWNKRGTGPKRVKVGRYCRYPVKAVESFEKSRTQ